MSAMGKQGWFAQSRLTPTAAAAIATPSVAAGTVTVSATAVVALALSVERLHGEWMDAFGLQVMVVSFLCGRETYIAGHESY